MKTARDVMWRQRCIRVNELTKEPCDAPCEACLREGDEDIAALAAAGFKVLNEQMLSDGMLRSRDAMAAWPGSPSGLVRAAFRAA